MENRVQENREKMFKSSLSIKRPGINKLIE